MEDLKITIRSSEARNQLARVLLEKIEQGKDIFWRPENNQDPEGDPEGDRDFLEFMENIEKETIANLENSLGEAIFMHFSDEKDQIKILTRKGIQLTTKFTIQDFGFGEKEAQAIKASSMSCFEEVFSD
jgi:hypothetical protein